MNSSQSTENYVKAIYSLSGSERVWVNTNDLAEKMEIKPSSVTDMIKKLKEKKLAEYQKYTGVKLTDEGNQLALKVIRKHRLWEVFLSDKLGFAWDEVHDMAEQLEHVAAPELVERLEKFLEYPKYDPHGDPIPNAKGEIHKQERQLLSNIPIGGKGKLVGVNDSSVSFLKFLENKDISLGCDFTVLEKFEFDGSMEVKIKNVNDRLNLSNSVCQNLFISSNA